MAEMLELCKEKMPLETGGILIGKYSEDGTKAIVRKNTGPPQDSKHGSHSFYRGIKDLALLLSNLWSSTGEFYLGEWHFHPNSWPIPSLTDKKQMKMIANDTRYHCPEPILYIIGGNPFAQWNSSCHVFLERESIKLIEDI
ncbi:Mov34/MPN/PAD-1 family protein [Paenibacillus barengoltzii]|nr:Mov34/MPN/PAD-1 family protein [Paenibacillus barengoltzii]